jgi:uncharacterized protein
MKKRMLIVFLSLISLNVWCQTDDHNLQIIDIPKTNVDIYYINKDAKMLNGKPYTGIDTSYFIDEAEKLLVIETFNEGFKTELQTFFDNGNPEIHLQWKNGKRDGVWKKWYKSGKVKFDYMIKNGNHVGVTIMFFENGMPQYIDDRDKSGVTMEFYENGKLKKVWKYVNDSTKCASPEGFEETLWRENGQLWLKTITNCGKQAVTWYYNDSTIAAKQTKRGMDLFLVGKHTEWYRNGNLKIDGQYDENRANIKTGIWKYYNEKGKLEREDYYENNEFKKSIEYIKAKKAKKEGL